MTKIYLLLLVAIILSGCGKKTEARMVAQANYMVYGCPPGATLQVCDRGHLAGTDEHERRIIKAPYCVLYVEANHASIEADMIGSTICQ